MDTRQGSSGRAAIQLNRQLPRLFLVTRREVIAASRFVERAADALAAGGRGCALQLRGHGSKGHDFWDVARQLAAAAQGAGAELWINDRIDVALAVRASGVQLGVASMPTREARQLLGRDVWIGRSVHGADEAVAAVDAGADVALLGHIYATATHPDAQPLGLDVLRQAAARPIVAIGGITPERVSEVVEAGAWGVAALSGVWEAGDPGAAVHRYVEALAAAGSGGATVDGRR